MAAQSIVCQAMPVNRPAPSKAAPAQTGPLARPAGFSQVCCNPVYRQRASLLPSCALPSSLSASQLRKSLALQVPQGFLGLQVRRTVPYAFNPALTSFGDGMGVPIFVRPDCPPEDSSSASAAPKKEKRTKAAGPNARPQFRSALEQVCRYGCLALATPSAVSLMLLLDAVTMPVTLLVQNEHAPADLRARCSFCNILVSSAVSRIVMYGAVNAGQLHDQ